MKKVLWDEPDIGDEEIESVMSSLKTGWVGSNGTMVKQFEQEFAQKVGAKYAIAVNNGTSALMTALLAFKVRLGKITVGVPTFTFIASANISMEVAGDIRLIDCSKKSWNIEKGLVPKDINVLMPVDVGGLPCEYDSLKKMGIPIVADSAESAGAIYNGRLIGTQADVHCFSFHRAKIITTGEGGMITTNNEELANLMRSLANHGYDASRQPWEYKHNIRAYNFRMTDLEAAVGIAQLKKLERYVSERRKKASIYREIIGELAEYQEEPAGCINPYFFFGLLINKDQRWFCEEMGKLGIAVKTWTPVHQQAPYKQFVKLPNADLVSSKIVLLPIHNRLSEEDTKYIAETSRRLLK